MVYVIMLKVRKYFSDFGAGKSIGHVTLRLLGPRCHLDPEWEEEDLASAAGRVMALLHMYSVEQPEDLDAPTFTYCFPFLNAALHRFAPQELDLSLKALKVLFFIFLNSPLSASLPSVFKNTKSMKTSL